MLQALGGGLLFNSFGAYFVYLQADFGWSHALISGAFSMARLESGMLGPLQGWLINRLGPQAVVRIGAVLFGGGFILLSATNAVPQFYGAFVLITLGASLAGFLTVNIILANWFVRRRARAMALGSMGLSFAGLLVPLVAWSLGNFGWRATAIYSGLLVFLLAFPVAPLFRAEPEPYGLAPDGEPPLARARTSPQAASPSSISEIGLTAREALRTPAFWLVTWGHTSALFAVSAMTVHLIPYLVEQHALSVEVAATVFAALTSVSWAGQFLGGFLGDRMEKRLICGACMVCHTSALVVLILANSLPTIVLGACLHGLAWGTRGPLMMAIRADYFGRRAFATIEGFASMVTTVGLFLGPLIVGVVVDQVGDYRPGFAVLACITAAGFLWFTLARNPLSGEAHSHPPGL